MKIQLPDLKGEISKIKNRDKDDWKAYFQARKERRERILEKRRNSAFARKMQPVYAVMNRFSPVFHALLACAINFTIEAISRHSLVKAWSYMTGTPLVFLYNALMIFMTFSIVYFFKRRVFVRIIVGVLWMVLGICNGYMLLKRVTPFNAQDLKVATDGLTLIKNYFNPFEIVLVLVGIAAVVVWIVSMWRRGSQYQGKISYVRAGLILAASIAAYLAATNGAIANRVVSTYFGNIAFAYQDYGLPYCFMASVFNTGIDEPNGYTKETIEKIAEKGSLTTSETGHKKADLPNIIFVQLESYFDVSEAEFFTTSKDCSPNLRKLFDEYSSGYFKVPSVGAGTANTEFEVLTGMNLRYFGPGEYPYKTVLKERQCESAASALKALGYGTHALHNNGGNFYSRAKVFNNIGFDSYTSKEFMNILQVTENGWPKDRILTQHIIDAMDTTEGADFVFAITVQGHGEYPTEKLIENPRITVDGIADEGLKNRWEYYCNQVYEMDEFVGKLVARLEQRGEPTVVVFYGDHLPTMGLEAEDLKSRYLYNTNYVIWDNIGLKEKDENIPAYELMAKVFERLDIHSGTIFNYHQQRKKTKNYLSDLELLQYDILYGERYAYEGGDVPVETPHMVMGVKDVTLEDISPQLDGGFSLYGSNFTRASKVYINGERVGSLFLNNTRLDVTGVELTEGDEIWISQYGSSKTLFRRSDSYVYRNDQLLVQPGTGTNLTKAWTLQPEE